MTSLYSQDDIRKTYETIRDHIRTRDIIVQYARNEQDIREVALEGLVLTKMARVLDLGCGYGFFTEKLQGRLQPGASVMGIDAVDKSNRERFLQTVHRNGYQGEFIHGLADLIRDIGDARFDMVVASYSLYFFPHLIPEIARILAPGGLFIAVTHSKFSLREVTRYVPLCMEKAGLKPPPEIAINRLFQSFCLENGEDLLSPHFDSVQRIVYPNDLLFPLEKVDDCLSYLDKKRFLIMKDASESHPQKLKDMVSYFNEMVYEHARLHGKVVITKDDAVFRCFSPGGGSMT